MMDEEIRQALTEVREMKKMCGNINMKLTNIVTQRGQDFKKKLEAEYQKGFEDGKAVHDKGCEGCKYAGKVVTGPPCITCSNSYKNQWTAKAEKFEFGDEIIDSNGVKGCVVSKDNEEGNTMYALFDGYKTPQCITKRNYRKTGKHYDIEKILEAMKHD